MVVFIRPYREDDLQSLIEIYKSVFAEPPWNEEWTSEQIMADLEFALSQENPIVLVAENSSGILGFTWGYKMPFEKFGFLKGKVKEKSNYMDEIAVCSEKRIRGVGTKLGEKYLEISESQGIEEAVLRTDVRNPASMALFRKLGFKSLRIRNSNYPFREYFSQEVGGWDGN